mmetsp:Transcript_5352/g.17856  ORF Transcript_5352/g.17856 Transcript_5352/m.17856 type:complete len:142 (+) Transcript_5352:213-638(+)
MVTDRRPRPGAFKQPHRAVGGNVWRAAQNAFKAGVATLAGVSAGDVDITSATKVVAGRRRLLASTFDIEYTIANVPAAAATAVSTTLTDPAQITVVLQSLGSAVSVTSASAVAPEEGTSGAAHVAGSMVAGALALAFALLA